MFGFSLKLYYFGPCDPLCWSKYRHTFKQQYLKNGGTSIAFTPAYFGKCSISFPMISRLIGFAFVALQLLLFKVCGIIGISKIEFFSFSRKERFEQNKKRIKNYLKPHKLARQTLLKQFQQKPRIFFCFSRSLWLAVRVIMPTYPQTGISRKWRE